MDKIPTRESTLSLVREYIENQNLVRHLLSVEAVMRHFARRFGEDEEKWGLIGLAHDLDWERFPEEHCSKTKEILEEHGWPEEWIRAIMSHGWQICTDIEPEQRMEKVLYAIDELTGLITATALMRPSRSILDMQVKSVLKKWKQKGFAAGANREVIARGAEMLNMELREIIEETIEAMRGVADDIGLRGAVEQEE